MKSFKQFCEYKEGVADDILQSLDIDKVKERRNRVMGSMKSRGSTDQCMNCGKKFFISRPPRDWYMEPEQEQLWHQLCSRCRKLYKYWRFGID